MRWNLTILISVAVIAVSYGLYQLSYEVQALEKNIGKVRSEISANEQAIQILKAEWAYQNRPAAIQELTAKYLPLLLVAPYQVIALRELPERQMDPSVKNIFGVPIPRTKPRFKRIPETQLPNGALHMANYQLPRAEE